MDYYRTSLHEQRREQFNNLKKVLRRRGKYHPQPYEKLTATKRMSELRNRLFMQAFNRNKFVAWVHVFIPSEILHAMGIVPFNLEAFSSMLSRHHLSSGALQVAEKNFFSSDSCSFLVTSLGSAIEGILPFPDILISTTKFCCSAPKIYYQLSKYYKGSHNYLIDVPYNDTEDAIFYVAEQLKEMVKNIEDNLGVKMETEKLEKTIEFSNNAREYFIKINELRRHTPAPILGREAIDYAAVLIDTWGIQEVVDIYKLLYQELMDRVTNNYSAVGKEKYRILWLHLRPYYTEDILYFTEKKCKAVIVFEEVNHIFWNKMDAKNPYRSLAKKLLKQCITSELHYKHEVYKDLIEKYNINGAILFYHKGCTSVCGSIQITMDFLRTLGIPVLVLEGECIDYRKYSMSQSKTRIQAFIELLESRQQF